jgi:hypothetical protein
MGMNDTKTKKKKIELCNLDIVVVIGIKKANHILQILWIHFGRNLLTLSSVVAADALSTIHVGLIFVEGLVRLFEGAVHRPVGVREDDQDRRNWTMLICLKVKNENYYNDCICLYLNLSQNSIGAGMSFIPL